MNWKPLSLLFFAFVVISCIGIVSEPPEKFEEFQPNPGEIFSVFEVDWSIYFDVNSSKSKFKFSHLRHGRYCYRLKKPQAKIVNKPFVLVFRVYNNANEIDFETQKDPSSKSNSITLPYSSDLNLVKIFLLNTKTKQETFLGQYKVLNVKEVESDPVTFFHDETCFETMRIDYLGPYS